MCYFCKISNEKNKEKCIFRVNIPSFKTNNIPDLDFFFDWNILEYPIMKGKDILDRPYIILKLIIGKLNIKIIQCFFFGYSLGRSVGCIYDNNKFKTYNLINTEGGMNIEQFKLIKSLVNGNIEILKKNHRISDFFLGHHIQIYDEKKWQAAVIIQKMWRKCRYNPKYTMCHKIQNNNLNEIYKENYNFI